MILLSAQLLETVLHVRMDAGDGAGHTGCKECWIYRGVRARIIYGANYISD